VLFEAAIAGRVVRPRWGRHPRLEILGTLEARLQRADLVVLGGLNEGVWPAEPGHDPWMSRPMRRDFGLKPPEFQIGLAAHDFAMALAAPSVVLTRAMRVEGAPTVPSRWLLRLDTVLGALGLPPLASAPAALGEVAAWQAMLDRPAEIRPCDPPAPRPPVVLRPRRLRVTEIETWMRDPYAIYARYVLGLRPLDPLDADPGAAERGAFIHKAFEGFVRAYPAALPERPFEALVEFGRSAFGEALAKPGVWAFWWPRFLRMAEWFVALEAERRQRLRLSLAECEGELAIEAPFAPFLIRAKADRIDYLAEGGLAIVDYKTGRVPEDDEVALGLAPQLPLEAAIAEAGGFAGVPPGRVEELMFWKLSGGAPAGEVSPAGGAAADPAALAASARSGLARLVAAFDDPATPYLARPRPAAAPRFSPYAHLARLQEWSAENGE
jgi:ATP-dependent helicase/nuclease subunit B